MHPYLFSIGPVHIYSYGFMMAAGFAFGLLHWIVLGRKHGYTREICTELMIWVMVSGIVGARIAYVLEHLSVFWAQPAQMFRLDQGGLVFYGGLSGAALAVFLFARKHKLAMVPLVDFTLTAVPLSHAFGRVGCFLNSCCFGSVCRSASCGVVFPRWSQPWHHHVQSGWLDAQAAGSLPVHPVQLYEAGFNLLVYVALLWMYRRQPRAGFTTALYMVLYALGRFSLEFWRGDHAARAGLGGISAGQIVSIPLALTGVVLLIVLLRSSGRGEKESLARS